MQVIFSQIFPDTVGSSGWGSSP